MRRVGHGKVKELDCAKATATGLEGMTASNSPPVGARADRALDTYLRLLAGGAPDSHFLELRFRVGEQQLAHHFHRIDERDALAREIASRATRTDVYVGCAPRSSRHGTKDAVEQVWTLWVECDGVDSARRLHAFRPRPALIVSSGSGPNCHAYWPLATPLAPERAEAANYRLATALEADLACFDASRILRPPGTWNFKHHPPRPVAVLRLDSTLRFVPDDVLQHAPVVDTSVVERRWVASTRETRRDPLLAVPPAVYVKDLLGVRPGRNGKVRCPFHDDDRPSLHVYPTGPRGWCCFSCRRGGTIYDLAAGLWNLHTRGADFRELRRRLLAIYGRELDASHGRSVGR